MTLQLQWHHDGSGIDNTVALQRYDCHAAPHSHPPVLDSTMEYRREPTRWLAVLGGAASTLWPLQTLCHTYGLLWKSPGSMPENGFADVVIDCSPSSAQKTTPF